MPETIANAALTEEENVTPIAGESGWRGRPIEEVIQQVKVIRDTEGVSQSQISRDAGVKSSTLSQVLSNSYKGRLEPVRQNLAAYLDEREERAEFRVDQLESPGWFKSPTADAVTARLQLAHFRQRMAMIVGIPGIGKTVSANRYTEQNRHNVWYVQLNVFCGKELAVLTEIANAIGIEVPNGNHADVIFKRVVERVRGTKGLIIIDEAHHANRKALDGIRAIYDAAGIGIALIANEELYARIHSGFGAGKPFAQFTSRVGIKHTIDRVTEGDVIAQARAWGIESRELVQVLKQISRKPGAMRAVDETLAQATLIAREQQRPIDTAMLREAYASHDHAGL